MRRLFLCLLLLLPACSHSRPFSPPDGGTDQPWDPGPPARLTVNPSYDAQISFTPDGRFLLYGFGYSYGDQASGCLALLPVHEARDSRWFCPAKLDPLVTDGYSMPAVSAGSRLAFVITRQRTYEKGPFYHALLTAPMADLRDTAEVTYIPFTTPDHVRHDAVDRVAWIGEHSLAVLADGAVYLTDPLSRASSRAYTALDLPGPVRTLQAGPPGTLYLTVEGDARVLAWHADGAPLSTVYDFGADTISAVAVGRDQLVAVTAGGLARVGLATGAVAMLPAYGLHILEIAMTPDAGDLIASASTDPADPNSDLYRLDP